MPFLSLNPTKIHVWLSLSLSLYTFGVKLFVSPSVSLCILNLRFSLSLYLLLHCSSTIVPPPQVAGRRKKKKNQKPSRTLLRENSNFRWEWVGIEINFPKFFFWNKITIVFDGCGSFSPNAKQDVFLPKLGHHLRLPTW